ncbi:MULTISPECIES: hypothetical protein [unclassified Streptomyces]|uniref:hypothetical protein n=1 Tax=unclassified Streptomyces TaxID=2593676 RepID=UPI00131CB555|nr:MULTISPECIES: hypothetical protein [unclassified Streptomyces]
MAYRKEVASLEDADPAFIRRNAAQFRRLHTLVESADDAFRKATKGESGSDARDRYIARLGETKNIADALSGAFRTAG